MSEAQTHAPTLTSEAVAGSSSRLAGQCSTTDCGGGGGGGGGRGRGEGGGGVTCGTHLREGKCSDFYRFIVR